MPDPLSHQGQLESKPAYQMVDHKGDGGTNVSFASETQRNDDKRPPHTMP
jgi:hypothetical protein